MLRIGLSGTNWTGKTETIKRFIGKHHDVPIRTVTLSPLVARCPFPMGENQTLEGSLWMIEQVKSLLSDGSGEIQLFDRTPLDILAFTLYAQDRIRREGIQVVDDARRLIAQFDVIFCTELSEEWPVGVDVAPNRIRFARLVDSYLRKAIDEFEIDTVPLPWQFSERVRLISQYAFARTVA